MFTYLVTRLVAWSDEVNPADRHESLTKLKLIKLLFFAAAADKSSGDNSLLAVFNNFYAMPYGHVESEIYNRIVQEGINNYSFAVGCDINIDAADKALIDSAINNLKASNKNLIKYTANELVDLSHEWYSWKFTYNLARSLGKYSMKIPVDVIKKERKFYSL